MRNVLVTGASRGIGLAIARKLAADGFRVLAVARKPTDELAALPEAVFVSFDLSDIAAIPELVRGLKAQHGPFYGLVNNAAMGGEGLLSNMHVSDMEKLVRLNTFSPMVLTKHAVRAMMTAGEGRIVNLSSIIASTGYSGLSVYAATKASMLGFTRSLAREVGRLGITVNAVAPGFIATEMTAGMTEEDRARVANRSALRRQVEAGDVAHAVSFLMSDNARNITGTVLTVDAGNTA